MSERVSDFGQSLGLRCEWGAGVLNLVLSLSLSHTGHWKFNMAPHGKELSEDLKKIIVSLHKDGVGYKNICIFTKSPNVVYLKKSIASKSLFEKLQLYFSPNHTALVFVCSNQDI